MAQRPRRMPPSKLRTDSECPAETRRLRRSQVGLLPAAFRLFEFCLLWTVGERSSYQILASIGEPALSRPILRLRMLLVSAACLHLGPSVQGGCL